MCVNKLGNLVDEEQFVTHHLEALIKTKLCGCIQLNRIGFFCQKTSAQLLTC